MVPKYYWPSEAPPFVVVGAVYLLARITCPFSDVLPYKIYSL